MAQFPQDDGQLYPGLTQFPPSTADPAVRLKNGRVECTSCHEPHIEDRDAVVGRFLVRSNSGSTLCLACHDVTRPDPSQLTDWEGSSHAASTHSTPVFPNGYPTVAENGCLSCHLAHGGDLSSRLLRGAEEAPCFNCHAGSGTNPVLEDISTPFQRAYAHPTVAQSGLHDAAENSFPLNSNRHAECVDCHNGHAASRTTVYNPPFVTPALAGVSGVTESDGVTPVRPAVRQYEICFKCHANSQNKPQASPGHQAYGRLPWRQVMGVDPYNQRLEFQSAASRHNVVLPRQRTNSEVPSLRSRMVNLDGSQGRSLADGTYIFCTDCHDYDRSGASQGSGPAGPHGSMYPHILERRYEMNGLPASPGGNLPGVPYQGGLNGTYALCNKCHDIENSILDDRSFKEHRKHIRGEDSSCAVCHAPHGVDGGSAVNNHALINFDLDIVGPSNSGMGPLYERTGAFAGRCYLTCHNENHDPETYNN